MEKILVTGAAGQIGSELVMALRNQHEGLRVIASGYRTALPSNVVASGPCLTLDVTDRKRLDKVIRGQEIDTIFHMSSILSALAEHERTRAYDVNIQGVMNILEACLEHEVKRVVIPSSIAAFGPDTPKIDTPNETIQRPDTVYGISKVFTELIGNYYFAKLGVDVRGLRLPGIISWMTKPTSGTTDYAVAMFHAAINEGSYVCYLRPDTRLPMMYMPDAIRAIIELAEAGLGRLHHHSDFNVQAMSFTPAELYAHIRSRIPDFTVRYEIDPLRQRIADSWPQSLDDSPARIEWGWAPRYDLEALTEDMLANLAN